MIPEQTASAGWGSAEDREAFWASVIQILGPKIRGYIAKSGCSPSETNEVYWHVIEELFEQEPVLVRCTALWPAALPVLRACCAKAQQRWRHELVAQVDAYESPDATASQQQELRVALLLTWCRQVLRDLPPKQRQAVQLHVIEGRDYAEVAGMMHTSQSAVRKNVHAGLARLRGVSSSCPPPTAEA